MYVGIGRAALGQPTGADPSAPWCGGLPVLRRMLTDLGYYLGPFEGEMDRATDQALLSFALAEALPYTSAFTMRRAGEPTWSTTPAICTRLGQRWDERFGRGAIAESARRLVAGKRVVVRQTATSRSAGEQDAAYQAQIQCLLKGGAWDAATASCIHPETPQAPSIDPSGIPGALPGMSPAELADLCEQSGKDWDPVMLRCEERPSWWASQSDAVKLGIIGAGVVAVGGVLYIATR